MENFVELIAEMKTRNELLFNFGLICLIAGIACLIATKWSAQEVYGVNAYYKPAKFALSTWILAWSLAYYMGDLKLAEIQILNWILIVSLGFEIMYIAWRASRGEASHFNVSTPVNALLFNLMAIFASIATLLVLYIAVQYFIQDLSQLPNYYVWAVRLGLILFVVFAFQGFSMGARLSHTVGAINDNSQLYLLGWSTTYGDLRIAHFIGMHALQILPIVSVVFFRSTGLTIAFAGAYTALATWSFVMALRGVPIISLN